MLLGTYTSDSRWKDGVLCKIIRDANRITGECEQWIVFDGFIDPLWTEHVNSVESGVNFMR